MAAIPSAPPSTSISAFFRLLQAVAPPAVSFPSCRTKLRLLAVASSGANGSREDNPSPCSFPSGDGDEMQHALPTPPPPYSGLGVPVFLTLPENAVDRSGHMMRRKLMETTFMALTAAGVVGVTVELWWGIVERDAPGVYDWSGYLDLVSLAQRHGLKVRAVMAFHQCGTGPSDPLWISLPRWVLEEMQRQPDLSYTDSIGRKGIEYLSLGCDSLPVLKGRTPVQAYSDFMRSFRDIFSDFLGVTVIEIQVGMGPEGELKYPSVSSFDKRMTPYMVPELGDFHCYDKHMLASLQAWAQHIGESDTIGVLPDPKLLSFFKGSGAWNSVYSRFVLEWYSEMLLLHGERLCVVANTVFWGTGLKISAKLAGLYGHFYTWLRPSELAAGYYNRLAIDGCRDGYVPIARMLARHRMTLCFPCFDAREKDIPGSSPQGLLVRLFGLARSMNLPLLGENSVASLDDASLDQIVESSRLYYEGGARSPPSLLFAYSRMNRNLFEPNNWSRFAKLVRQLSDVRTFDARIGRNKSCLHTLAVAEDAGRLLSWY